MQNRNLPAVYKPRGWRPFSLSFETRRTLAAIAALFRHLYRLNPHGFMLTSLLGVFAVTVVGVLLGAASPPTEVNRASIMLVPIPERAPSMPKFEGNQSTFEGEVVGKEITEPAPPKVVVPLVDPIKNVRPAIQKLKPNSKSFINKWAPVAQRVGRKCGVPASIILAQALLESNSGVSALAQLNNNYFGHKCFSKTCGRGHCSNYTDDTHKDFFVVYKSAEASFTAHAKKISEGRYASLKKNGKNYRAWAKGLKAKGYATAGHYASSLINTIEKEGLARFDR
jgi:Mannosyl-glycoprotein endo-beta-N-acetylglucosaminidase